MTEELPRERAATAPTHRAEPIRGRTSLRRIPLGFFGVPLGFTGFGGAWGAATTFLGAPPAVSETLYAVGAASWTVLTVVYVTQGLRGRAFRSDLHHPATGPFAAYLPLVAALLAAHYTEVDRPLFDVICWSAVAGIVIVAVQLLAHWITGSIPLSAVNPGYLIPLVAGANVASIVLTTTGEHRAGEMAMGAGLFFWVVVTVLVVVRLFVAGAVPATQNASLAAFLAAAATANLAWLIGHPGPPDEGAFFLLGVFVVMLALQVLLLPRYIKVPFGLAWWTFAFPLASSTNFVLRWFGSDSDRAFLAWAVIILTSAFFATVAIGSFTRAVSPFMPR